MSREASRLRFAVDEADETNGCSLDPTNAAIVIFTSFVPCQVSESKAEQEKTGAVPSDRFDRSVKVHLIQSGEVSRKTKGNEDTEHADEGCQNRSVPRLCCV